MCQLESVVGETRRGVLMNRQSCCALNFLSLLLIATMGTISCKQANPVDSGNPFPERSNYTLVLESGTNVDSIFVLLVDASGNNMKKVPSPSAHSTWPLVSPDRKFIAFRPGTDFMSLYLFNFATGQSSLLLTDRNWDEYAWSASSDHILYCGNKTTSGFVIKTVNISSSTVTAITDSFPGSQRYPHWLPNGSTLAYVHYDNVTTLRTLHSIDLTTNQTKQLVEGQREASWSPDGLKFFANQKIYSWPGLDLLQDLSSLSPGSELFGKWFPNSRDLLVHTGVPDEGLYKIDMISGMMDKVFNGQVTFKAISISSDGKLLAFIPSGPNNRFIVADSTGKNQQSISLPIPGANYRRIQFVGDVTW